MKFFSNSQQREDGREASTIFTCAPATTLDRPNGRRSLGVAIATYNGGRYLQEQLDSIAAQTRMPDHIVISDDGSTDDTVKIARRFSENSSLNVSVLLGNSRMGVMKNFLRAFRSCDTDLIAYCDQDDVWHPSKLELCESSLNVRDVTLVLHRSTIADQDLRPIGRFEPHNIEPGIYAFPHFPDNLWGYGHQMVFDRRVLDILEAVRSSESPLIQSIGNGFDFSLIFAAGMLGSICFRPEQLVKFRRHDVSCSPAGKQARSEAPISSLEWRAQRVFRSAELTRALLTAMDVDNLRRFAEPDTIREYRAHLVRLSRIYAMRKVLYEQSDRLGRFGALAQLLGSFAYGSTFQNKLPGRQLILDCLQVVR